MGTLISLGLALFLASVCAAQTGCQLPLGMESGAILDGQISATTWLNILQGPRYARLHKRDGGGGWTASTQDLSQYLTIDLGSVATVTAVATQGRFGTNDYVTEYKLMYSADGSKWTTYSDNDLAEKLFPGNTNGNLAHKNVLPNSIEARYVRFNPMQFIGALSMRVEVYGCLKDTAYFDGTAYIKYDVSQPVDHIQSFEDLLQMRFRTSRPDGLLAAGIGRHSDYIFLQLRGGKVHLSLNLGDSLGERDSGALLLEGGSLLDDNQWHLVQYKRQRQMVELVVDGVAVAARTNGHFERLDLDKEMTIGGTSVAQHRGLSSNQFFVGCLQGVLLSNSVDPSRLGTALDFIKGERAGDYTTLSLVGDLEYDCRGEPSVPATFPTESSYLQWPGPSLSQNFTISLKFRTFSASGLLVNNQLVSSTGGYITVGLNDGTPVVILKTGTSRGIEIPGVGSDLNDGRWHSVRLEMANNVIRWTVDRETNLIQRTFSINTDENYFVGGTTGDSSEMGDLPGFLGCMVDVVVGNSRLDFRSILDGSMPQGAMSEGVDVDTCSLEDWCTPSPCANGGECMSDWDTFTCKCTDTGYTGTTCSIPQHSSSCQYSGTHMIDPDGSGPLPPVEVECESQDSELYTVIQHDAETSEGIPPGNTEPGSYSRDITYQASSDQIRAVVDMAEYCEQYIQYVCTRAKLLNSPNGEPYGWWVNRDSQKMNYWGGAAPGTGKCECGLFETCQDRTKWCNCDADTASNLMDEGLLRHKQFLPVKQLRFGDVKASGSSASYRLGPLRCRGNAYRANVVTFRSREAHLRFPILSLDAKALVFSFEFKTTQDSAVLAAADGQDDTFVKLELEDMQTLVFSFDYGAGGNQVNVGLSSPINNNEWHHVMLTLDTKEATLTVDQGQTEKTKYNMGKLRLRLTDDFFIGASTLQSEGFVGCMRNLQINGRFIDMVAAGKLARQVEAGCSGKCDENPCLNGGKCIETYDEIECQCDLTAFEGQYCSKEIGSRMESGSQVTYDIPAIDVQDSEVDIITLAFTTEIARGRLLRVENSLSGTFEEIAIRNPEGYLTFTWKLGSGAPNTLTSEHKFADGRHHYVKVEREGNEAVFKVDGYQPLTKVTPGVDTTFNGANKVYVGSTEGADTFEGCISRVKFNDVYPLRNYFATPTNVTGEGDMQKSRCNVQEVIPAVVQKPSPKPPTKAPATGAGTPLPPAGQQLTGGDKAAIAFVVIVLLLALIILVMLILRYKHQHKGMYHTNEAKGADMAGDADTAVMMTGAKQVKPEKKKEWYI
ncbi:neurexin-4-like [Acanthaster planci]|uniref:Neurexin-4-like n=1 Tax=Acanthaster planci TaxID=133434 RepID=A0A8B7Y2W2_ACAPL|nr:neurexin-4-like [Acanthaster planci]